MLVEGSNIRTIIQVAPNIRVLGTGGTNRTDMRYVVGNQAIVGGQAWVNNAATAGLPGALTQVNFVTAGYTAPCQVNQGAKGSLYFSLTIEGPVTAGNPPIILVGGNPFPATNVPLQMFTANDALIPWLPYTAQNAGTYRAQLIFRKTGQPDIIDEWVETWVS